VQENLRACLPTASKEAKRGDKTALCFSILYVEKQQEAREFAYVKLTPIVLLRLQS